MNHKLYRETRKFIIAMGICLSAYVILSALTSCSEIKVRDNKGEDVRVRTFRYEGHRYLKFTEPFSPERMGIIHDPECLKHDLKR